MINSLHSSTEPAEEEISPPEDGVWLPMCWNNYTSLSPLPPPAPDAHTHSPHPPKERGRGGGRKEISQKSKKETNTATTTKKHTGNKTRSTLTQ